MSVQQSFRDLMKKAFVEKATVIPENGKETNFEGKNVEARLKRLSPSKMDKEMMLKQLDWVQQGREPSIESQNVIGIQSLRIPNQSEVSQRRSATITAQIPANTRPAELSAILQTHLQLSEDKQNTETEKVERDQNKSNKKAPRVGEIWEPKTGEITDQTFDRAEVFV